MEVTCDNFEWACADIEQRLPNTAFIAVDLELTGIGGREDLERFSDLSKDRLSGSCEVAENFAMLQFGLTLCQLQPFKPDEMTTYNIIMAPESCFLGEASALEFFRRHGGDLNKWVDKGVRLGFNKQELVNFDSLRGRAADNTFIFRASGLEESRALGIDFNRWIEENDISKQDSTIFWHSQIDPRSTMESFVDWRFGFVRLWHLLRRAARPLVVHGGLLDLFFILSNMEMQRLPRNPKMLAQLAKECFPSGIYDTSHLHEAIDELRFLPMNLRDYHQKVVQRFSSEFSSGSNCTAWSNGNVHQAGFDSLLTAELFRCLCLLYEDRVEASKDRLYLHNCGVCLDLGRACEGKNPDGPRFGKDPNVTLLVAEMHTVDARKNTPSRISEHAKQDRSLFYRKTNDARFLLVVLRCRGLRATQKAEDLGDILPGVTWFDFDAWRRNARSRPPGRWGNLRSPSAVMHDPFSPPVCAHPPPGRHHDAIPHTIHARSGAPSLTNSELSTSQVGPCMVSSIRCRNRQTNGCPSTRVLQDARAHGSQSSSARFGNNLRQSGRCTRASPADSAQVGPCMVSSIRCRNRQTNGCPSTRVLQDARAHGSQSSSARFGNNLCQSGRRTRASPADSASAQQLPAPLPVGRVMRPVVTKGKDEDKDDSLP
eukprot:TRINITY_DN8805_c0_g1_i2.p1 TRINITY_DN8805_c0_g1~~TRINITY_DN8805_c0_g1_i2.p1  ORF type:complete len:655 (+),score=55.20 TRINITY_DN8805_c0_g1_i2:64-2028(+)